ncbi:hypothetical protein C9374_010555 [Naegleria lovaniensis]|uniref:PAS domain-containing protein n=1 Tax=Naegleria lovaniensis TaxID=51637 RepID=A0AA88KGE0_NAELO|nr:uncharacterized protein C9374_010555 [Naegleria lovaniensis]KAG2374811.1 hypothetical protein C9374_010555 [Naegleria lovaniensis]
MSSTQGHDDHGASTTPSNSNNAPPNNNNSSSRFIPFYMRDDLPQNRQSKSKVNQRRRRKTIQDVLQQKSSLPASSNLNSSSLSTTCHSVSSSSTTTPTTSTSTPTNILPRQPLPPPPIQPSIHSQHHHPVQQQQLQHQPSTQSQHSRTQSHSIYPPSLRARYPSVLQSYPHYVQLPTNPLPFPPSPYHIHQFKQQQEDTAMKLSSSPSPMGSSTGTSQGLPLSEISNRFGGLSEQYKNSALQRSSSASSLLSKNVLSSHQHVHHNEEKSVNPNVISSSSSFLQQDSNEEHSHSAAAGHTEEHIHHGVVGGGVVANSDTSKNHQETTLVQPTTNDKPVPVGSSFKSSIASFLSSNGSKQSPQRSNAHTSNANTLLIPSSSAVSSTTSSGKVGTASASSSTAVHKLKRLQQQIRSSDKDLHAINSSAQVLNYLKMVQQQQQAYIQQRLMLQSSSIPNLNVSVNHIKDQLYSNINNASSSGISSDNNATRSSSSYLPSTFIPSYQLDPTVDMMISNWENQIRQTKQRQRMQQLYRRPIPNLRLPPHQDHSQYMMDSSSSESSSGMGSHSDRSEAWMSARFGASTLSSSSRVSARSMGISPLNSPSSSCSMSLSDCTAAANATAYHENGGDYIMISPHHQQQQHSARSNSNNSRLTAEQLSPEDEDEDGDTLMIDDSSPTLDNNKDSSSNNLLPSISKLNLPINLPPLNLLSLSNKNSANNNLTDTSINNNSLSTQTGSSSAMEGVKSCPTTPHSRESQHSARSLVEHSASSLGIQQLFTNPFSTSGNNTTTFNFGGSQSSTSLATTTVQPNSISLNTSSSPLHHQHASMSSGSSNYSYIPEGFVTHRTHQQHHFSRNTKQIHHQIHSSQHMSSSRSRENHLVNAESVINNNSASICPSPKRSSSQYLPYTHLTSPRSSKKKKVQESSEPATISDPSDVLGIDFIPDESSNSAQPNEDIQQRMSMQLFQAIFRHTPLPMFILNSKGKFMSVNHAFISMLGYESEACFTDKNALEFVYSETDSISLMTQIQKSAIEGGIHHNNASGSSLVSPQQHFKMSLKDSNGSLIQAENTIYVLRDVMYGSGEFFVFTVTSYQSIADGQ